MLISVCIPVYNGEKFLRRCLDSVAAQTYKNFEIVVVDDCSPGTDENGWNCKKICKFFTKQTKIKVNLIRNSKNLGCIDSRRNGVYEAKGDYIFCLDCDDALKPDCLEKMAATAIETKADIVQCGAEVVFANDEMQTQEHDEVDLKNKESMQERANLLYEGELLNEDCFNSAVVDHQIIFFVWGKLINRDVFISAWEMISPSYCVWGEDYVIYFYVSYFAKKYVGIKDKLYVYSVDTGISSKQHIDTLERWEKICSVSSAFSMIYDAMNSGIIKLNEVQTDAVQRQCNTYVLSTFRYLKYFVVEELKDEAYEVFCDYWGKDYVQKILEASGESL